MNIKYMKYVLWLLALLPLLLFRDFTPDNELRYLSIADEAIRDGHLFTFYNHGVAYADKPPLYLWIVMLSHQLWGTHCMVWLGLFSLLPAFVILFVMDRWLTNEIEREYRTAGQLMLLTTGYFLGAAVVLRMDMLMSMFIVLALYVFYQSYTGKSRRYYHWLLPLFLFLALFTKGPLGLLIPVCSIFIFLAIKKQWRQIAFYLGWRTWVPVIVLCGVWFALVYREGGEAYLNNLLFHQTVNRAIDSFRHKKAFYYYFQTVGYAMAPWVLFYITVLIVALKKKLLQGQAEQFFLTVVTVTLIMLSLISSKVEIYLLPAYPFFVFLIGLLLPKIKSVKVVSVAFIVPAVVLAFSFPAVYIAGGEVAILRNVYIYSAAAILSLASVGAIVAVLRSRQLIKGINLLAYGLLFALFAGGWALPRLNSDIGYRDLACRVNKIALENKADVYAYKIKNARDMSVYFQMNIEEFSSDDVIQLEIYKKTLLLLTTERELQDNASLRREIEGKELVREGKYVIVIYK